MSHEGITITSHYQSIGNCLSVGEPGKSRRVASGEAEGRHCRAAMSGGLPKMIEKAPGFFANTPSFVHKNEILKIFKAT